MTVNLPTRLAGNLQCCKVGMESRVTLICPLTTIGGTEQVVRMLGTGLRERATTLVPGEALPGWMKASGGNVQIVPELDINVPGGIKRILRLVQAFRPHRESVGNIHFPTCSIYRSHLAAMKLAGFRKIVVSLHHPVTEEPSRVDVNRRWLDRCDAVVFSTESNRQLALDNGWVSAHNSVAVPLAVYPPAPVDKLEARRHLNLPADAFVIGSLCRLVPDKRIDVTIQACHKLVSEGKNIHLLVGGNGPEFAAIKEMGERLLGDRFHMLGWLESSKEFYSALDTYCMPSELEGFGLAYIEAGSFGVPSIGCAIGGSADAIKDGITGFLVPPDEPIAMVEQRLRELYEGDSKRAEMGKAAHRLYEDRFTIDVMASAYTDLFEQRLLKA